jgi:hypothetical protein
MAMYVYSTDGDAVGFLFESFIFDLAGDPLGRIMGSRVHRLDGSYAGEWFHEMVVSRRDAPVRSIFPIAAPERRTPPPRPDRRRAVAEYRMFPDAFDQLYATDAELMLYPEAAE